MIPPALIARAALKSPPSEGSSVMTSACHTNARSWEVSVAETPTTCAEPLTPCAWLYVPPSVPRSSSSAPSKTAACQTDAGSDTRPTKSPSSFIASGVKSVRSRVQTE
jgi:hypothetical protein